jgi:hypothetical protein
MFLGLFVLTVLFGVMSVFSSCALVDMQGGTNNVINTGSSSSGNIGGPAPSDIMKVYSDRTTGTNVPIDPSWQIWNNSVSFNPVTGDGVDGGDNCTECVKGTYPTIGFGILTNASIFPVLTNYNYLVFSLRVTNDFSQELQVGVGDVGSQSWYSLTNYRDNLWHTYVVNLTNMPTLGTIGILFGMRSTSGTWSTGTLRFDDVYYTKTIDHLSNISWCYTNEVGSVFALYSETFPQNVTWDTDAKMFIWNGFLTANDTNTAGDGSASFRVTANSSTWGGLGWIVNPSTAYRDLSSFTSGKLVFMVKSTKNFTKVGIEDANGIQGWVTGSTCLSSYGYTTNGSWSTISIPLSAFTGVDFTQVKQYFMFVADGGNYTVGNVWNIDNVYFTNH